MKKALLILLSAAVIISILFIPGKKTSKNIETKNKAQEVKQKVSNDVIEVDSKGEVALDYNTNLRVFPLSKNEILIYDGKKLIKKDDKLKNMFSVRLEVNDYAIKVSEEDDIYILDRTAKLLYKVSKDGEVLNQTKFAENVKDIYPISNTDVIVQYNTSVTTDGLIILDKDLKKKQNIEYPKAVVNTLSYSKQKGELIVSCQVVSDAEMKNAIYIYNSKYEALSLNQMKDTIIMDTGAFSKKIVLLDPFNLYIKDDKFADIAKIQSHRSFDDMLIKDDRIYLLDGPVSVRVIDSSGKAASEKNFKQQISDIIHNQNRVLYVGKDEIYSDSNKMTFQKDIQKAILLENDKIAVFFRNSVKIAEFKE